VEAEWNFFATSHGKSPCEGTGGTVKRLVTPASCRQLTLATFEHQSSCLNGLQQTSQEFISSLLEKKKLLCTMTV